MTSTDGITWTAATTPANLTWNGVTYGAGKFVAVASTGSSLKQTMYSTDGINWTLGSALPSTSPWRAVAYGGGQFVAVGGNSSTTGTPPVTTWTGCVMTSSDGINWTVQTNPAASYWDGVVYTGSTWVAVAKGTSEATSLRAMTSTDGVTWTARTTPPAGWTSVAHDGGRVVAVSTAGKSMYSDNEGSTWTQSTTGVPANDWRGLTVGMSAPANGGGSPARRFVAVADTGTGNRAMYSSDGISWTAGTSAADNSWSAITYGDGKFVAVGITGTGNRVMTSNSVFLTFAGDALTINPPSGATSPSFYQVQYNTTARINASAPWGAWANKWPTANTSINLATYQSGTTAPCGTSPTVCSRTAVGQQLPGATMQYRVIAAYGSLGYQSPNLSVTRPAG